MDELSITLPVDDWEFTTRVLACQAADYDLMAYVNPAKQELAQIAGQCRRIAATIREALTKAGYTGKYAQTRNGGSHG